MRKILIALLSLVLAQTSCSSTEEIATTHPINYDGDVENHIRWLFFDNKVYHVLSNGDMVEMPFDAQRVAKGTILINRAIFNEAE